MKPKKDIVHNLSDDVLNAIEASVGYAYKGKERNMVMLYWRIGKLIRDAFQDKTDSSFAKSSIKAISEELAPTYGTEYSEETIKDMVKFSHAFEYADVVNMSKILKWSHFKELIDIDDEMKRNFYAWMCVTKNWSPASLRSKINSDLYEKSPTAETYGEEDFVSTLITGSSNLKTILGLKAN